ncbi:MAG: SUMF1/EgtB/PvdO family nonheme iron enzyme, partial [Clostridia bacterium]|nr:SUMF1/EgtB/PvdO family nonheme iron enzyme [Clostridia bacterium]
AMNKIPYNHMPWTWNNSMSKDTGGAVEVARKMYPESNSNYGVVSTLTYGVQWDRTVQWFVDTGVMTENQVNKTEGSTEFGNYNDHVIAKSDLNDGALVWDYSTSSSGSYVSKDSNTLTYPKASGKSWALSTGALKDANINNIYDMAGNMYEWTMEGYSTFDRAIRGGSFIFTGTDLPVAYCDGYNPNTAASSIGFRPSLYIK